MSERTEPGHRIVVGVDGSAPSKAALAWALGQAGLTSSVVDAVIAWEYPALSGQRFPVSVDLEEIARRRIAEAIAEVAGSPPPAGLSHHVVEGNAAQALLDASAGADLLVVGNRGHGGFVGALLGSISQHCVHHASCPVVVVRGGRA